MKMKMKLEMKNDEGSDGVKDFKRSDFESDLRRGVTKTSEKWLCSTK